MKKIIFSLSCMIFLIWTGLIHAAENKAPPTKVENGLFVINPDKLPVHFPASLKFELKTAKGQGENQKTMILLEATAEINNGWHIYAMDHHPEMAGVPTAFKIIEVKGMKPPQEYRWIPSQAPEIHEEAELKVVQRYHNNQVTWQTILGEVDTADLISVNGWVTGQVCSNMTCKSFTELKFQLNVKLADLKSGEIFKVPAEIQVQSQSLSDKTETASKTQGSANAETTLASKSQSVEPESAKTGKKEDLHASPFFSSINEFGGFLVAAVLAGYIALLTPCVYPMVPVTISVFLKHSEKRGYKPVSMAMIFCLGIIGTFTILGVMVALLFGSDVMSKLANSWGINLLFSFVLIFFGMSMLGMFEIVIPGWMLSWSAQQEERSGVIGILFIAVTFTLVSFTCTFAFVGTLLISASQGAFIKPIIGMLAFSTAFASPFFFLALFPSYLHSLPKTGGWMNRVKVTLGIIEIGAALKFLSVVDFGIFSDAYVFDYTLVMILWMILCFIAGIFLLGAFKLPNDTEMTKVPVTQFIVSILFLSLGAYLGAGVFAPKKPRGILWEQIQAFAPPEFNTNPQHKDPSQQTALQKKDTLAKFKGKVVSHDSETESLPFALDFNEAVEYAKSINRPLFVDFTGVNCINCRKMEHSVFPKPENQELLAQFVRVQIYVDRIPGMPAYGKGLDLLNQNTELQTKWLQDATLPAYAVVTPDGKTILEKLSGYQPGEKVFTNFLITGMSKFTPEQAKVPSSPEIN